MQGPTTEKHLKDWATIAVNICNYRRSPTEKMKVDWARIDAEIGRRSAEILALPRQKMIDAITGIIEGRSEDAIAVMQEAQAA